MSVLLQPSLFHADSSEFQRSYSNISIPHYLCSSVDLACSVQFHMLKGKKVEVKRANSSFGGGRNGANSLALPLRGYDVRQGPTPKRGYTARFSPFGHHSPGSAQPAGMHLHAPYYRPVSATASTQDVSAGNYVYSAHAFKYLLHRIRVKFFVVCAPST